MRFASLTFSALLLLVVLLSASTIDRTGSAEAAPVIGSNSCTPAGACDNLGAATVIGDNSCNGADACDNLNGEVGDGSCLGPRSCDGAGANGFIEIGDGSCIQTGGGTGACEDAASGGTAKIGDHACVGDFACYSAGAQGGDAEIDGDSCNYEDACWRFGEGGTAKVGSFSCNAEDACQYVGNTGGDGTIGVGSCNGYNACYRNGEDGLGIIGDSSCNGEQACYYNGHQGQGEVGNGSCNGSQVCYQNGYQGSATVGDLSCYLPDVCYQNQGTIGDCEYVFPNSVCIIITKEIVAGPQDVIFDFTGGYEPFSLGDGDSYYILSAPGAREVTEVLPPNWQQVAFACDGGTITRTGATARFNPSAGDFLRCTVSNAILEEQSRNRPPNIGAGLSGLFAGQPTPLPTAPSAPAPAATAPVITPPRTGDGGLAD